MKQREFKVGDKVEIIDNGNKYIEKYIGKIGIIRRIVLGGPFLYGISFEGGNVIIFNKKEIKFAERATQTKL